MKRHGFKASGAVHGSHRNHRKPVPSAVRHPGRVFKGMQMAGRMGGVRTDHPEPHRPRG
jgi:large subunit ribosomal protein L3